jgi:DNA-binding transcriptional regulator YbjK
MNDKLLDIELRFLIHRYGKQRILSRLANIAEQTLETLEQQINELEKQKKQKTRNVSIVELARSEGMNHPESAELLRSLAIQYQNRNFLPQLRDVQRFLDQAGVTERKVRSREAAAPLLIKCLTTLSSEELQALIARPSPGDANDYLLLARAILGKRETTKPGDMK